jgi:ectoine hydroxylase-related dioxygenase (phytanoyl-CoA dioxygenase family)
VTKLDVSRTIGTHGFAIIPSVLASSEISPLLDALSDLEDRRSRAGIRHVLSQPAVSAIAHDVRIREIAGAALGYPATPFRATLFDKSPDSNWLIAWHQDTALPLLDKVETPGWGPWSVKDGIIYAHAPTSALVQVVALRLHLDDSTEQNGPLRVLPGTHVRGVLTDEQVEELAKQSLPFTCLVAKGGVLAMRPLLIHASSKSQVESSRRVLHIEYAAALEMERGLRLAAA